MDPSQRSLAGSESAEWVNPPSRILYCVLLDEKEPQGQVDPTQVHTDRRTHTHTDTPPTHTPLHPSADVRGPRLQVQGAPG